MNIKIDHTQVRDAADVLEALAFNGDEHNFGDVPTDKVRYTAADLRAIANDPDLDYYRSEAKSQLAVTESQARTIAALRGQITKQRNKIAALTEQGGNQ